MSLYTERVSIYQIGNLGVNQYFVKLNARTECAKVGENLVIWMNPALVINI